MSQGVKILFGVISYFLTSYIGAGMAHAIHAVFPKMPKFLFFIIPPLIIVGIIYYLLNYVIKDKYDNIAETQAPKWYQGRAAIAIGAVIGGLLGGGLALSKSGATVYFDNGTPTAYTLKYYADGEQKTVTIPSGKCEEVFLEKGKAKISLNDKESELDIVLTTRQLYNIDTANTYIRTEIVYGKQGSDEKDPKMELIKDQFFEIKADYVFEAPESIKGKRFSGSQTKSVLYRMKDMFNMMGDEAEKESDSTAPAPEPIKEEIKEVAPEKK